MGGGWKVEPDVAGAESGKDPSAGDDGAVMLCLEDCMLCAEPEPSDEMDVSEGDLGGP